MGPTRSAYPGTIKCRWTLGGVLTGCALPNDKDLIQ